MTGTKKLSPKQFDCLITINEEGRPTFADLRMAGFRSNTILSLAMHGLIMRCGNHDQFRITLKGMDAINSRVTVEYVPDTRLSSPTLSKSRKCELYGEELFKVAAIACFKIANRHDEGWVNTVTLRSLITNTLAPHGWTFLGQGASRMVFRGPDGYAYKLSSGYSSQNEEEHRAVQAYRGQEWSPASSQLWRFEVQDGLEGVDRAWHSMTVLRMPCYEDAGVDLSPAASRKLHDVVRDYDLADIHSNNVIVTSADTFKIIDLGIDCALDARTVRLPAVRKLYSSALVGS